MQRELNLDRVSLDGVVVRRRSATLHIGTSDPRVRGSPWWVSLACARLPDRYRVGHALIRLEGRLISGRAVHGQAMIVERRDDAYGTALVLAGIASVDHDVV